MCDKEYIWPSNRHFCQNNAICHGKTVSNHKFLMFLFLFAASASSFGKCDVCKSVATIISQSIAQGLDDSQIQAKIDEQCRKLGIFSDICNGIVSLYYNKLISYLRGGESASAACKLIHVCKSNGFDSNGYRRHHHGFPRPPRVPGMPRVPRMPRFPGMPRIPRIPRFPTTNGAPVFQTETSPTWSQSWEEDI